MSRLIRQICACLAVTLLVTMQAYAVASAQHQVEHGLQFPGVSFNDSAQMEHDHRHDDGDDEAEIVVADLDHPNGVLAEPDADDDNQPVRHHHHSGVDLHVAIIGEDTPPQTGLMSSADLGPTPDALPPGADRDLPSDPPRQLHA